MHTSGKVLAGFVILGFLGAFYLTTKAFDVRDKWMELAQKNEAAIKKNDEEIATKTRTLRDKRNDYARTMIGWDREWTSPAAQLQQDGGIALQVGTNQGIQPGQLIYVFAPNADGTSVYVGDFKVVRANEGGCQATQYSAAAANRFQTGAAPGLAGPHDAAESVRESADHAQRATAGSGIGNQHPERRTGPARTDRRTGRKVDRRSDG